MEKFADINLLGDMFSCLDETEGQQLSLARSLEDLRIPKDPQEQQKFTYQVAEGMWRLQTWIKYLFQGLKLPVHGLFFLKTSVVQYLYL